jgi:hypothetical protein
MSSQKCEICRESEATHHVRDDWHLCDRCYKNRTRWRMVAATLATIVLVFLLSTWQCCVIQPAR